MHEGSKSILRHPRWETSPTPATAEPVFCPFAVLFCRGDMRASQGVNDWFAFAEEIWKYRLWCKRSDLILRSYCKISIRRSGTEKVQPFSFSLFTTFRSSASFHTNAVTGSVPGAPSIYGELNTYQNRVVQGVCIPFSRNYLNEPTGFPACTNGKPKTEKLYCEIQSFHILLLTFCGPMNGFLLIASKIVATLSC